jgi:GT2 family glycosyltransferase
VWLVVSSFRHDREIATMLEGVQNLPSQLFSRILIVDSLGTGEIPKLIARRGWQNVVYYSYDHNLGSAGNLSERLRLAAEAGADLAYALNHDGHVQPEVVRSLLKHAMRLPHLGAIYPLAYKSRAAAYNITGTRDLPLPAKLVQEKPRGELIDVYWSSSNGALYTMEPVRAGLLPWSELWMGWEDLEYGWRLTDHDYRQVMACDAVFIDNYEYVRLPPWLGSCRLVDKPAWTTYYSIRNLVLVTRRTRPVMKFAAVTAMRVLQQCFLILLFRRNKILRLLCLLAGLIDGLRNRTGKWILPKDTVAVPSSPIRSTAP